MFESITESTVTTSTEMLVNACSMSLSDVRQAVDIISEPATHADGSSLDLLVLRCGHIITGHITALVAYYHNYQLSNLAKPIYRNVRLIAV